MSSLWVGKCVDCRDLPRPAGTKDAAKLLQPS